MKSTAQIKLDSQGILNKRWFLFSVVPGKEKEAGELINRSGFTAAVPCVAHWRRKTRHTKSRRRVLYPAMRSFIMVGFSGDHIPFYKFRDMPMIHAPVGFGEYATQLCPQQVAEWLLHPKFDPESLSELTRNMRTYHEYKVGDTVQIMEAGFDGVKGKVTSLNKDYARILVPMFYSEMEIDVRVDFAVKAA